ncbi:hypothetical protein MASR2M15_06830 [Anaerolineales bacterium]
MLKKIDNSNFLNRLIQKASAFLSKNRGLPILIGIVMIIIGFIIELINVHTGSSFLETTQIILRNLGIIIALIGLMVSQPLGG